MRTSDVPGRASFDETAAVRRRGWWWLLAILAAAALLRFWSIDHGLPYSYYPDETHFVKRSVAFGSGDLNPHWFHKPAFFMYVLFFHYGAYFVVGKAAGWWDGSVPFAHHYFNDPTMFYLFGRIAASVAGLGVVFFGFLAARRLAGSLGGVLAAAVIAANFCLAEAGRWVKADVPCTLFTLMAMYFLVRAMQDGRRRDFWYAGLAMGAGMATKYYALALVPAVWLVHWLRPTGDGEPAKGRIFDWRPWGATLLFGLAFFALSPYNLLDGTWLDENIFPRIGSILHEKFGISPAAFGAGTPGLVEGTWNLLRCLFKADCVGWIWGPLGAIGLVWAFRSRDRGRWVPALCVLPFSVMAVVWNPIDFEPRYLSAIVPMLAIAASVFVTDLWRRMKGRGVPAWLGVALFAFSIVPGVVMIINWNQRFGRPDTRTIAVRWLERHLPADARVINDNDHVKLRKDAESLKTDWMLIEAHRQGGGTGAFVTSAKDLQYEYAIGAADVAEKQGKRTFPVYTLHHPWWPQGVNADDMGSPFPRRPIHPVEIYHLGYDYIVTTAKTYDDYRVDDEKDNRRYKKEWVAFYRWLRTMPLIYEVPYQPEVRSGPTVRVYRVPEGYEWALDYWNANRK